jgi:hypothetical protein
MLILNNTYNGDFSSFLESCYCKDDTVHYDAFRYQLLDKISANKLDFNLFNEFEMDSIFKTLLFEIKKKTSCIDEAMTLSPTFRLYVSYIEYKKRFNNCSFFEYVRSVALYIYEGDNAACNVNKIINKIDLNSIKNHGTICKQDICVAEQLMRLQNYSTRVYNSAKVCGTKMVGRGMRFRETAAATIEPIRYGATKRLYIPHNKLNILKQNWNTDIKILSSWCRLQKTKLKLSNFSVDAFDVNSDFEKKTDKFYGQINFFLHIYLPGDSILHGVSLCSVNARKYETISFLTCIMSEDNNIVNDFLFCSMTDVVSTKILIGAVDDSKEKLPFIRKNSLMHDSGNNCEYSSKKITQMEYLYLIELDPMNDSLLPCRIDFRYKWNQLQITTFLNEGESNSYADTEYDDDDDADSEEEETQDLLRNSNFMVNEELIY